jgi:putative aldouronate transport system permease protein
VAEHTRAARPGLAAAGEGARGARLRQAWRRGRRVSAAASASAATEAAAAAPAAQAGSLARSPGKPARWRRKAIRRHWQLYAMLLLPMAFLAVFNYWPILGAQIAFRNYNPVQGIWGSPWTGFQQFELWVTNPEFWPIIRNTLVVSVYSLVVSIPATIILALLINEVRHPRFKKFVQSVTYFPYFISVVVLIAMMQLLLNPTTGLMHQIGVALGFPHLPDVFGSTAAFSSLYVWSGVWQETGYGAIIYLGVLSTVDTELYEAARIDGASILQRIRHVDFPAIRPTIVILVILGLGSVLGLGFEKVFLLQNPLNIASSQIVSTYVYQIGIVNANFSFGTAVGLFNSVISLGLVVVANFVARRAAGSSLF